MYSDYDYEYYEDDAVEHEYEDEDHVYIDGSVVSDSCAGKSYLLLLKNLSWIKPSYIAWIVIFAKK